MWVFTIWCLKVACIISQLYTCIILSGFRTHMNSTSICRGMHDCQWVAAKLRQFCQINKGTYKANILFSGQGLAPTVELTAHTMPLREFNEMHLSMYSFYIKLQTTPCESYFVIQSQNILSCFFKNINVIQQIIKTDLNNNEWSSGLVVRCFTNNT